MTICRQIHPADIELGDIFLNWSRCDGQDHGELFDANYTAVRAVKDAHGVNMVTWRLADGSTVTNQYEHDPNPSHKEPVMHAVRPLREAIIREEPELLC